MCNPNRYATLGTNVPPDPFIEVRGRSGKLRCRYNPATHEVEFVDHGKREIIDLKHYQPRAKPTPR